MPDAVPPPPPPAPGPAASLKRKLDETIAELGDKNRKRAKRANPTSTRSRFLYAAKLFARGLNPHIYFPSVLDGGAASLWQPEPAANVDHSDPEELERVKEFIDAFTAFMVTLPADCREVLKSVYLSEDDTHWPSMVSKLKAAATGARTNDTNGLKHALHYFLEDPSNDQLNPPIHKTDSKSDRGLNHPMLRLFLLPCKYRRVIETLNNPGIVDTLADGIDIDQIAPELLPPKMLLERLLSGAVPIEADHFPSFLYANGACNPDDLAEGLLRGEPFVRILRHLWTGPSSVLGPVAKEIPKGCNADTHEARKITPGICGVAACQGRTMLSTKDWGASSVCSRIRRTPGRWKHWLTFNDLRHFLWPPNPSQRRRRNFVTAFSSSASSASCADNTRTSCADDRCTTCTTRLELHARPAHAVLTSLSFSNARVIKILPSHLDFLYALALFSPSYPDPKSSKCGVIDNFLTLLRTSMFCNFCILCSEYPEPPCLYRSHVLV
ncbi:hypothetical protein C8J57DRAFT_1519801 [Mycena rebaudengoi]|nr:hypothetical protein C8J57DRAFT_1519801 [Mycena rebaudengoi]